MTFLLPAFFIVSMMGCATRDQREASQGSASQNEATAQPLERVNAGVLDVFLVQRTAATPLGKMREMKIDATTPVIQVNSNDQFAFPFIVFQLDQPVEKGEKLFVESTANSFGVESVGLSSPQLYSMKEGKVEKLKLLETTHESVFGSCLIARWKFDLSGVLPGSKIALVNEARGFESSMGKIDSKNPNLKLKKSIGFCTMISLFPDQNGSYKISIQ